MPVDKQLPRRTSRTSGDKVQWRRVKRWKSALRFLPLIIGITAGVALVASLYLLLQKDRLIINAPGQASSETNQKEGQPSAAIELTDEVRARLFAPPKQVTPPELTWHDANHSEIEMATAFFKTYMDAAGDWGKLAPLVRSPGTTIPAMEAFYRETRPVALARAEPLSVTHVEWQEKTILRCEVIMTNEEPRTAFLVWDAQAGRFLLDWKSFEPYLPAPWQVYLHDRPAGKSIVRVIIKPTDDYAEPFSDRRKFDAFHLSHPYEYGLLFAYVERGTEAHDQLVCHFAEDSSNTVKTMILQIRYPDDALSPRQVEITEVISPFWLLP